MKKYVTVLSLLLMISIALTAVFFASSNVTSNEPEKENFYMILASDKPTEEVEVDRVDGSSKDKTMSDYVAVSTHCVIGEFKGLTVVNDELWEYEFVSKEKIYGKEDDSTIKVRVQLYAEGVADGGLKEDSFTVGHKYILILQRNEDIFLEYPRYSFMGFFVMDVNNLEESTWKNGTVRMSKGVTKDDIVNHILSATKDVSYGECSEINMFRTEDVETVIKNCDAIFKVKPSGVISQGVYEDVTVYRCSVTETLKGELTTNEDKAIFVVTFRNALKVNSEYILPLSYVEADTFYHQASPICIFDAEDIEMETKIKEWLSEKNVP